LTSDDATKAESRQIIEDLERKLAESVTQQAATSDILRVISQSPTDVRPVFDAIVLNAVRLFRCDLAFFLRRHGNTFSQAALVGSDGSHIPLDPAALPIDPEINFPSRTIVSRKNLHLPDWSAIDLPEHERRIHETYGINSSLFLPLLLRGGECFGLLALASKRPPHIRQERDFTGRILPRPGRDRDRECAAIQRGPGQNARTRRIPPTADCDRRRTEGHQPLGVRSEFGHEHADAVGCRIVQGRTQRTLSSRRRPHDRPRHGRG